MRKALLILTNFLISASVLGAGFAADTAQVGPQSDGGMRIATGQSLHPAGEAVALYGRPVDLGFSPDGRTLYVKSNDALVVIDAVSWKVRQMLRYAKAGASMHGLAVSADGLRVYVTDAGSLLREAVVSAGNSLAWGREIALGKDRSGGAAYGCGIALSPDGRSAYVCLSRSNALGIVDLASGEMTASIPVQVAPWGVQLSPDGRTAYISDWGGLHPGRGDLTAVSAGTPTRVDERGIASTGAISVVDIKQQREVTAIPVGLHPCDMALDSRSERLYVANANSDTVSVIDTTARRVTETIDVRPLNRLPFGSQPTALTLSADGRSLYVALGANNAAAVIATPQGRRKASLRGLIPTGWFPGAVALHEGKLFVADVKGLGSRNIGEQRERGFNVYQYTGTIDRITLPSAGELRLMTNVAITDSRLNRVARTGRVRENATDTGVPAPTSPGEASPIRHVVYIIKENRTYDQVFGDMARGNGDPRLCIFGRQITPNHHALAEQFVLLDNFYCNGVLSADGHSWATEGSVTDHLERAFGGFTRSYTFGDDPLTYSSSGFLWDAVLAAGLSFRNFGEMDYAGMPPGATYASLYRSHQRGELPEFKHSIGIDNLRRYSDSGFPGWNMSIPDQCRADRYLAYLKEAETSGRFPNLSIIYLPNDHTGGDVSPASYLADNDLALGRIVEGISKSSFWPRTAIFVVEDDPQAGFDHVDGHRSLCLVASPYTKRGVTLHNFYNQTSVLRTIGAILGVAPTNQLIGLAPIMSDCFTRRSDTTAYAAVPNQAPILQDDKAMNRMRRRDARLNRLLADVRFDRPDSAPEDAMNRFLWQAQRGDAPYPAALAGAHGSGLPALGLRFAETQSVSETESGAKRQAHSE